MVGEFDSKFLTTKLDGLRVEAGDAREVADGGGVGLVGKCADIPAALRLGHTTEQQVDLVVVASQVRVSPRLASTAFAAMYDWFRP